MDNDRFNFNDENLPRPRYINEYRKMGDIFLPRFGKDRNYFDKLLFQIFISLIILAVVLLINSININIAKNFTSSIKKVINWKVDLQSVMDVIEGTKLLQEDNEFENETPTLPVSDSSMFIMPVEGEITSQFGQRVHPVFNTVRTHNGIDISGQYGDKIKASMSGIVTEVGEDPTLGKYIWIVNGEYRTLYAHCSKIIAQQNQKIKQGDIIAEVGDSGLASGVHLHFEIWENGEPVNPLDKIDNP
ncbi:M23 family metallopeptidase [Lutispora thermophila]|uniref:Peptidase family M23 n=1 Tax=Lutispora thermophila DSM 19022 TaxID=1122184 RepID=A0A1M6FSY5_9FIRM|nr:M23 family metallopeptidase [Lutispora thermophila]SHJ00760.1 Peptidase family M23 [Lutispora thermophila DSM 19022]